MNCGCSTPTCGCCDGVQILTPLSTENRPGLPAISYRAGTHGAFFETMQARLSSMNVTVTDPVTGASTNYTPLTGLTTRNPSDPAIALLDAWATVGDVLCFYQERIANEGYLGTATELQSVAGLADLVGYQPRPGVSASVYLAFTVDPNQTEPTDVPVGTQAQSIPGPGQLPQTFETSLDFEARVEWNNLQVELSQPQTVTFENSLTVTDLFVSGTSTSLNPGDQLLFVFRPDGQDSVIRRVAQIFPNYTTSITDIQLAPLPSVLVQAFPLMVAFVEAMASVPEGNLLSRDVTEFITAFLLGGISNFTDLVYSLTESTDRLPPADRPIVTSFLAALAAITPTSTTTTPVYATQSTIIQGLIEPTNVQARSSADLQRSYSDTFAEGADVHPRMLQVFAPALENTLYPALSAAAFETTTSKLLGLYAFTSQSPLFGGTSAQVPTVDSSGNITFNEWPVSSTDQVLNVLYLAQPNDSILPASYVMIQDDFETTRQVQRVTNAQSFQRSDYGLNSKTTQLTLQAQGPLAYPPDWNSEQISMQDIRQTLVYGQTNPFTLVDIPVTDDVSGHTLDLDQVYDDLQSGRYVVLTGIRTDIPGVTGVTASELLMVSSVLQTYDAELPGDSLHSRLILATPMAYTYARSSVTINANVVLATNGATTNEILGSGAGSQTLQSFTLKQPPLTFVPAPNPQGILSTLQVFVNGVQWLEAPSLALMGPKDHEFITQTSAGQTTVIFGNGIEGARLPTGVQNVVSQYRTGIGSAGNVDAGQISLMQTKPLGILSVINGTGASGGADPEDVTSARANAPLAVMALDRLVSIQDYADFSRTFAGIGKATSLKISNGQQQLIHITIAGTDDIPIDETSDLYINLVLALEEFGIVDLPLQVDPRELLALVLSANVAISPLYQWDLVSAQITALIFSQFGFSNRCLGQSVALSQIISLIQSVPGVTYVSVQTFGGIPEKRSVDGVRQLLTPDQLAAAALKITKPEQRVVANLAAFENGVIRPAQLAMFLPTIPESVILNNIS